ncbi:MAG: carbohydrate kinase family protein, partial [Firmicutes bacterium]|nr:carbohydrate kinase family protein [Bacillota bacterium]
MARVLAVGPVFVDSIYAGLPCIPEAGQEVYGDRHLVTVGGFAITAIGLARLGLSPVIVSAVGGDLFGRFVEERLQAEGVSTEGLVKLEQATTSHSTAMVLAGDRRFVSYAGAYLSEVQLLARWVERRGDAFRDVKSMHVDLVTDPAIIDYLDEAKRQGVMISMTCGWPTVEAYRGKQVALREMLQRADLLFCNEIEAVGLSGTDSVEEAMGFFREVGCHPVITLGAEGAVTLDEAGQVLHEKALAVELVDPTGAGDSFAVG